jgi:hypothetical protein
MVRIYRSAKSELGYNATRFLQMITEQGGLASARQLLHASGVSDGFTTLWEHQRLDLSVEAHVLQDEFASLFTDDERRMAKRRLTDYGYPTRLAVLCPGTLLTSTEQLPARHPARRRWLPPQDAARHEHPNLPSQVPRVGPDD